MGRTGHSHGELHSGEFPQGSVLISQVPAHHYHHHGKGEDEDDFNEDGFEDDFNEDGYEDDDAQGMLTVMEIKIKVAWCWL